LEEAAILASSAAVACLTAMAVALVIAGLITLVTPAAASPDTVVAAPAATAKAPATRFGLFGSLEFRAGRLDAIAPWKAVRARIDRERPTYAQCDDDLAACPVRLRGWRAEIAALTGKDRLEQLRGLNRFVNGAIRYRSDAGRFGRADYWASPAEVLTRSGDCEDYAIAKFVSLIDLGFSASQVRIAVVRDTVRRIDHAVVTVSLDGRIYVLDSLFDEPVPHQYVLQYVPVYSVNLDTRWAHVVTPQIRSAFVQQVAQSPAPVRPRTKPVAVVELTR
jgi:predicted transglutaminase-like cysteine proteinase